ncbi:MAG: glutamine amidotransferase [Bacilli bacterium]|nr:glutamine amidotransferase [Bacilli bacterium]
MEKKTFKIHFLEHASWVEPGVYLSWAKKHGYDCSFTRVWNYEKIPSNVDADMLIVLGGPQNPGTTQEECDFYDVDAEKRFIQLYASFGKIVVGSCLGAQLLGEAMGATFFHSPYPEVGHIRGSLTPEGRRDPLLKEFPDNFDMGEWHNDMPGLTHNAEVLAYTDGCPHQIVKYGKYLYGFQTHMEMNLDFVKNALNAHDSTIKFEGPYIQSEEELLNYDYSEMNRLLESFLDNIVEEYLK